ASADDGTGGGGLRSAGATVTITGLNRSTGTLTASGNWTAGIAAVAAGDYLFPQGDYNNVMPGALGGWLTTPGGGDSFYGVNRNADVTRLAGLIQTGAGN